MEWEEILSRYLESRGEDPSADVPPRGGTEHDDRALEFIEARKKPGVCISWYTWP